MLVVECVIYEASLGGADGCAEVFECLYGHLLDGAEAEEQVMGRLLADAGDVGERGAEVKPELTLLT